MTPKENHKKLLTNFLHGDILPYNNGLIIKVFDNQKV